MQLLLRDRRNVKHELKYCCFILHKVVQECVLLIACKSLERRV